MFDILNKPSEKIIYNIGIIGYNEDEVIKRGVNIKKNLPLHCLYIYPNDNKSWLNNLIFQMMFPDDNHQIQCPKFFSLTLTDEKGTRSFLYCLKFSEKYDLSDDINKINEIEIPLVIFIKSGKEDLDSFKQLLNLINYIIINNDLEKNGECNYDKINGYKKVQLLNLFYFIFSLPYCPPHSMIKLELCNEFKNYSSNSIDFYFSSNCEIPCNKNDADINILFLLLDQSIIIKVLFSILTEKQIVFRASQVYLLHIIIPSFLKLIFPFKWLHKCITVLPSEKINFLEAPGPFIFGVLSSIISLEDLTNKFPGKIIVDCDTNEIYGDSHLEPFSPPKENISLSLNQNQNKNNKKEKENNDVVNIGKILIQGNNAFNISGSYLFKYDNEINSKKHKFNFDKNKNNIIIDTQKSQLLVDKSIIFIDSNEWKWLRRNIQLVRNPEIFYLDNLSKKKKIACNNIFLSEEDDENVVLPNRTFSYNIQNIFLKFILNKLSFTESDFMLEFKNTNLYLNYNEPSKYQNNSGKRIVENILELKDNQRNIDNCFNIEYSIPKFDADIIINKLNEKIKSDVENKENKEYEIIKYILDNYMKLSSEEEIIGGNFHNNNDCINVNKKFERKLSGERKSDVKKISRITKLYRRGHERNKTSVLQETFSGDNKFILFGNDNTNKGIFKFYTNKGFLKFILCFEKIMKEEKINISEIIYGKKIFQQIINIILDDKNIFKNNIDKIEKSSYNIKKPNKKKENFPEREKNNKTPSMPIITENVYEEEENENNNGRDSVIQNNIEEEFDFTSNIMSNLITDINEEKNNDIINFPNIIKAKENNTEENEIEYKMQYYLFIAKILEETSKRKEIIDNLMDTINKNRKEKITLNSLLLKLYRLAFKYSGIKHRDFPYFSYYNFLSKLNLEQLKMLNKDFNDFAKSEIEIFEIYGNVNLEKEKDLQKKQKKLKEKLERANKNMNLKEKEQNHNKRTQKIDKKESNNLTKVEPKNSKNIENNKNDSSEFNKSEIYIINSQKEFEIYKNEELGEELGINIVFNLAKELNELTSIIKDIKVKSSEIIIEEMNKYIMENKMIFKLVEKLKYINIKNISSLKSRMCFWLNCYNFLILFTIFYKKWNLNSDEEWKCFFRNVKYNIGGDIFSFNDIQYLIYQKIIFFESEIQVNEHIKNYRIHKSDDAKNIEKKFPLLYNPFMIYLPIKGFNKPIIYEENQFESQINNRISDYFLNFVRIDYYKNIHYYELLTEYCPNFFNKELKKFQSFIIPTIYNFIKDKKYKTTIKINMEWKLDFGAFLDNFN